LAADYAVKAVDSRPNRHPILDGAA